MGRVETPDCPVCKKKAKRFYTRLGNGFKPVGFYCEDCNSIVFELPVSDNKITEISMKVVDFLMKNGFTDKFKMYPINDINLKIPGYTIREWRAAFNHMIKVSTVVRVGEDTYLGGGKY
ncbi:MAG: hypothetical protein KIS29_10520 [Thermoplasmata archaeon]|nr:hypothetical protein [Candidatus Sysuiplasma jiujiangense]